MATFPEVIDLADSPGVSISEDTNEENWPIRWVDGASTATPPSIRDLSSDGRSEDGLSSARDIDAPKEENEGDGSSPDRDDKDFDDGSFDPFGPSEKPLLVLKGAKARPCSILGLPSFGFIAASARHRVKVFIPKEHSNFY